MKKWFQTLSEEARALIALGLIMTPIAVAILVGLGFAFTQPLPERTRDVLREPRQCQCVCGQNNGTCDPTSQGIVIVRENRLYWCDGTTWKEINR